jgi:hypothetical protein
MAKQTTSRGRAARKAATPERGGSRHFRTNGDIAKRVYRALKTPSDDNPRTDPILAFHFDGKDDYIMMRCNKNPEISIKGKDQTAGEVKFFAYSAFADYGEEGILFELKDEIRLIELYRRGAIEPRSFKSWGEFTGWLDSLDENGVQISLKLPCLVYESVRRREPSMQNFIVEAIKDALRDDATKAEPSQ